ncbi:MAG TPA: DUF1415 domain-containing protein [Sandaracinaceae bacterium LLY-WYZ-13_1]|nr:DUF1415 domain-containing protein [Sandaracinaceae bacterium LLY-WYZ-13_1]
MDEDEVRRRTRAWIERVVVGLGLCPFARAPLEAGRVRVAVTDAAGPGAVFEALDAEVDRLVEAAPSRIETTLLACPAFAADDFEAFDELVGLVEAGLRERGLEGVLQVASFHPHFRFGDAPADDPGHWTNRAPFPLLHLLREASVEAAVAEHPDPDAIWRRNVARMRALSLEARRRLRDG